MSRYTLLTTSDDAAADVCERLGFVEVDRARYFEVLNPTNPDGADLEFFGYAKRYALHINRAGRTDLCASIRDGHMVEPTRYFVPKT